MANWNLYETRMTIDGNTERDNQINTIKNSVLNNFANSPSYFLTLRNGIEQGFNIVEENEIIKNPNKKRVICKPDETIIVGDIIEFDNSNWICTENDTTSEICDIGIISKSNNTLLFYPSQSNENPISNDLIEIPCIVGKGNINLDTNKFLSIPADENLIICPNNSNSSYINENTRFILSGSAYVVQGIDNISNVGLLNIRVKQDQISADDNLELGIANYWSNQVSYEIKLVSNSEINLQYLNQTSKIELILLANSIEDTSPILSIINSNPSVCIIDVNTLTITCTGIGTSDITINYHDKTVVLSVTGISSISHNYAVSITPVDINVIKIGQQSSFIAKFTNNGDAFLLNAYWSLLDDTETLETDLASIVSISGVYNENIIIKANTLSKYGYCKLIVKDISGNIVYKKRLQIKSLI